MVPKLPQTQDAQQLIQNTRKAFDELNNQLSQKLEQVTQQRTEAGHSAARESPAAAQETVSSVIHEAMRTRDELISQAREVGKNIFVDRNAAAGAERMTATSAAGSNQATSNDGDSVLANVDLFDLNSLGDAIAEVRDQIANGEGDRTQLFQDLQLLLQSQMQLVSLISNMQKVQHDTAMAAINNIR